MSSPSRQVIDPLICAFSDTEKRPSSALSSSGNNTLFSSNKPFSNQYTSFANQNNINTSTNPTSSWTPLVSRTFTTEMGSVNSTPSSKFFSSLYRQNDVEFAGISLTPFLTHNMNLMPTSSGNGNNGVSGNFTPFYDKTMHMEDFFMDSPIRPSPTKRDAITPSKFALSEEFKDVKSSGEGRLNPSLSVVKASSPHQPKRSITQLDTPARHQAKKSDLHTEIDVQNGQNGQNGRQLAYDSENDENTNVSAQAGKYDGQFVTPSKKKVLRDTSASVLNKTPLAAKPSNPSFLTPAAKCPISSPSTVIMSSAVKSPAEHAESKVAQPPTPTPNKEGQGTVPKMGIFSENKVVYKEPSLVTHDPAARKKAPKKPGTSKFQIVFTDMHTLMNSKKKSGGSASKKLERKKSKSKTKGVHPGPAQDASMLSGQYLDPHFASSSETSGPHGSFVFSSQPFATSSFSNSQEINTSMASSKEYSMSTTAANMTTIDHASFEVLHGSFSTPNGKFLLDNSFEKQSPLNGHSSGPMVGVKPEEIPQSGKNMPPPSKNFTLQQAAQIALRSDALSSHGIHHGQIPPHNLYHNPLPAHNNNTHQQMFVQPGQSLPQNPHYSHPPPNMAMDMSMSTPQHERIASTGPLAYQNDEQSPSEKANSRGGYQQMARFQPAESPSTFSSRSMWTESDKTTTPAKGEGDGSGKISPEAPVSLDATKTKKTTKRRPKKR